MFGQRLLPPLGERLDMLADRLVKFGALGLILVDAGPLLEIERRYGSRPFRAAIETLAQRVRSRVAAEESGEEVIFTSGALREEHLLVFLPRPRDESAFYTHDLLRLTEELRGYVGLWLKRIVYPYLAQAPEIPVGSGICLNRPFMRPEAQLHRLIDETLEASRFEVERQRRERANSLLRILIEEDLRNVYEPIVHLESREVIGFEALSRGPTGSGLESPLALFEVAEAEDLEYELDGLCRHMALEHARGLEPGRKLFLNILPSCIHDPAFSGERLRQTLDGLGIAPRDLVLEISERQAISNYPIFREAIDHFSKLGFGLALDDMGAGFSTLEAALELSPDFLKIDMSLVRGIDENPHKQEVVSGLKRLATRMSARLVAEGIETSAELGALQALGVSFGQGYLLGRGTSFPGGGSPEAAESE